jgi:hypothetical protein
VSAATFASDVEILGTTTIGPTEGATCTIKGTCAIQGGLTMTSGTASLKTTTVAAGHDIDLTGDSAGGVFARVQALESGGVGVVAGEFLAGYNRAVSVMGSSRVSTSYVCRVDFAVLPMFQSSAPSQSVITGRGSSYAPDTLKYDNRYTVVLEGTTGTSDLATFTKQQTSATAANHSRPHNNAAEFTLGNSDWQGPSNDNYMLVTGSGYLYWEHSTWETNWKNKNHRMVCIMKKARDAARISIDGNIASWQHYDSTEGVDGTGDIHHYHVFVAHGPYSAVEVMYYGQSTSTNNYLQATFTVLAAWD